MVLLPVGRVVNRTFLGLHNAEMKSLVSKVCRYVTEIRLEIRHVCNDCFKFELGC